MQAPVRSTTPDRNGLVRLWQRLEKLQEFGKLFR